VAGFLHSLHITYNENDRILEYQNKKLKKLKNEVIQTLIVGDSSAGNAIDAEYFSKISGSKTVNVALTGSYGLIGSLNMIKRVVSEHKELKNIIIMQSLDIWYRELSLTAYFKTKYSSLKEMNGIIDNLSSKYLAYLFNIQEINWFVKSLYEEADSEIDLNHDYTKQKPYTFSNEKKSLKEDTHLKDRVNRDKIKVLAMIDRYCGEKELNCIYLHGPLHVSLVKKDRKIIENINSTLSKTMKNITFIAKPFALKATQLGDSNDHVDIGYKLQTTKESYNNVKGKI
jgi:hypothetical protein